MKVFKFIFFLSILGTYTLNAQEDTLFLDLETAWQMAIDHHPEHKRLLLEDQVSAKELDLAKTQFQPQVSAGIDLRYNIAPPVFLLPGETVGQDGDLVVARLSPNFGGFPNINVNKVLFNAPLKEELKVLAAKSKTGRLKAEIHAHQLKQYVCKNYFNVLISQEYLKQLELTNKRLQNTQKDIQTRIAAELIPEIEMDRIQLAMDNNDAAIKKALQNLQLHKMVLKSSIGIQNEQALLLRYPESINDPLNEAHSKTSDSPDYLSQMPETRYFQHQAEVLKMKMQQQQKQSLPVISLYGNLGLAALGDKYERIGTTANGWHLNSYIGLNATWSLNNYLNKDHTLNMLQLQANQTELQLQKKKQEVQIQEVRAISQLETARIDLENSQKKEAFASKELDYVSTRFKNDLARLNEVIAAEQALSEAQQQSLSAQYRLMAAYFELKLIRSEF